MPKQLAWIRALLIRDDEGKWSVSAYADISSSELPEAVVEKAIPDFAVTDDMTLGQIKAKLESEADAKIIRA
jgi:hypothetical protein